MQVYMLTSISVSQTRVSISAYAASFSSANFENPNAFDPDRWRPDNVAKHPEMKASQPFGQGHRSCLGKG